MLGGGIVSSLSDFLTVILPIPIVMRLRMPLWHRIGVCLLLCLGVVVTIAGSIRTYYTWKSLMASYDETWYAYPLWIAAAVEIDLGVICACAPALKSLLQKPLKEISERISEKLGSLRSPSHTQNGSSARQSVFHPLRSLPWFQITRLDFERTQRAYNQRDMEGAESSAIELREKNQAPGGQVPWTPEEAQAPDLRHPELAHRGADSMPSSPALQIMMRHSFDQCSDYMVSARRPSSPQWHPQR